mmetsp:Transcript_15549/g.20277  ORF Transcript_15549/g.20277 Transcript_15549/m.20277 type:complete len:632 (-) Transcript_15549:1486-3381(-)|eukprot:CAMPEP_0116058934 /NCGR_PEP_ID=MMETSP0322-20121206/5501_1 /TAXON_ID=163516 /ORGANISM="Leptocylindrus danicus var. apora, Strain B651" /LENGTH=631 /DNA_ID=CAMNT_0003543229 /DNA_START=172 /DNA_END=2067 /DNA_ORIENTATION=-
MVEARAPQEEGQQANVLLTLFRFACMFYGLSLINSGGNKRMDLNVDVDATATAEEGRSRERVPYAETSAAGKGKKSHHKCLWKKGSVMTLDVYITESEDFDFMDVDSKHKRQPLASWHEDGLTFDSSPANSRNVTVEVPLGPGFANNETRLFAHAFLSLSRGIRNRDHAIRDSNMMMNVTIPLMKFKLRKKAKQVRNLLGDGHNDANLEKLESTEDDSILGKAIKLTEEDVVLAYIKPSVTLEMVDYRASFPRNAIPSQMSELMTFNTEGDYFPILYPSEFWITSKDLVIVNGTLTNTKIELKYHSTSNWKWMLMSGMERNWKTQEAMTGDDGESDVIRTMLMDTNPWLLAVTGVVSLLHSLFDFLAFKNDITFFKGRKSMEGLSVRSMVVNFFFQLVIFLYLLDNDTSYMVLVSNGVGIAIEFWKLSKALSISFAGGKISWNENESYKTKTKEYDEIATSHLLFVTMPLVAGYAMYSLLYLRHKNFYSWGLNTLVGFIYMFGFIMMTPQLFINYKLKSVAHINWRTMCYKSINTFIDDLFAFVIKMPLMHRLACLRDDVIFFIYLYQRHIYKVDYTRVNEFGQCEQPTEVMLKDAMTSKESMDGKVKEILDNDNTTSSVPVRRSSRKKDN